MVARTTPCSCRCSIRVKISKPRSAKLAPREDFSRYQVQSYQTSLNEFKSICHSLVPLIRLFPLLTRVRPARLSHLRPYGTDIQRGSSRRCNFPTSLVALQCSARDYSLPDPEPEYCNSEESISSSSSVKMNARLDATCRARTMAHDQTYPLLAPRLPLRHLPITPLGPVHI